MQSQIPQSEQWMPEAELRFYMELLSIPEKNKPAPDKSMVQVAAENVKAIREEVSRLKQRTLSVPFPSPAEEILFFKVTKPHFHALLIEWSGIFDMELFRPQGGREVELKYLQRQLRRILDFFKGHEEFISYYRSGLSGMDGIYFLRSAEAQLNILDTEDLELDLRYTTGRDRLAARLLGYERLQRYIERSVSRLQNLSEKDGRPQARSSLQWTGSKAGLVELVYALHSSGVCNNGNADIKFIAGQMEQVFQVELTNFYHVFNEIRLRKKSRTQMLDTFKESVVRKMDEMDER